VLIASETCICMATMFWCIKQATTSGLIMNMSELEWRRKHASISAGKKSAIAKQSHLLYVEINDLDGSSNHVPNLETIITPI